MREESFLVVSFLVLRSTGGEDDLHSLNLSFSLSLKSQDCSRPIASDAPVEAVERRYTAMKDIGSKRSESESDGRR